MAKISDLKIGKIIGLPYEGNWSIDSIDGNKFHVVLQNPQWPADSGNEEMTINKNRFIRHENATTDLNGNVIFKKHTHQ